MDEQQEVEAAEQEVDPRSIEIPKTVTVGNREVTLVLPKSLSVRYEIAGFYSTNANRARAAALGLCWGGLGRPKARYESSYSLGQYGGEVLDELLQRGIDPIELRTAGTWAIATIFASFPRPDEVDRAEGNSGGQAV